MTDKQIIIDGINVAGCGHYWNGRCHAYVDNTGKFLLCINSPNCYYKQLKRAENQIVILNKMVDTKKQECEELRRSITKIFVCLVKANRTGKIVDTIWVDNITTLWDYIAQTLGIEGDQTRIEEQILQN